MKKILLAGTCASALLMGMSVINPYTFAKESETAQSESSEGDETFYTDSSDYEEYEMDYGDLTDDEISELEEIYTKLYDEDSSLSDEEYKSLNERRIELEVKAGYYGSLTEEEAKQLNDYYDQQNEIYELAYGEDGSNSEEEAQKILNQYAYELDQLDDKILPLEVKAGYYGELTEAEAKQLNDYYDQESEIYELAYGEDGSNSDEEAQKVLDQYAEQLENLEDQILTLEIKAGYYGNMTKEEIQKYNDLVDQYNAIYEKAYGEDGSNSEEEAQKVLDQYADQLKELESEMEKYESKMYEE